MPTIHFTFESGETSLDARSFRAFEGVSRMFEVAVVALSHSPDIDLEAIAGKAAVVEITSGASRVSARQRRWKGVVSFIEQLSVETLSQTGQSKYGFTLLPKLWLLTQRRGYRVFQHLSVPDIVRRILTDWHIDHVFNIDEGAYPKLEYKVQYGESDYAFVCRLLEEAGIAFTFPDGAPEDLAAPASAFDVDFMPGGAGGSLLTLSDDLTSGKVHSASPIHFVDEPNQAAQAEFVTNVKLRHGVRPGALTVRDHDFRNPDFPLFAKAPSAPAPESAYELYHYQPGAFLVEGAADGGGTPAADDKAVARHKEAAGTALAERWLTAERTGKRRVSFQSNVFGLRPGVLVAFDRHPHPELSPGELLLVTDLEMHGTMTQEWGLYGEATFAKDKYRPPRETPKPEVKGVQTATVVGPPGEEIHTDEFGRARVQFPWDRLGTADDNSSCWVRVSQGWAGTGYGSLQLPRVGQEVLVGFIAGDPDRPIIVGRVYNAKEQVPYKLPEQRTRSTWKSSSTPGGVGYNELMFDDAKDREQVYLQAQKDLRKLVKNDETMTIGHDRRKLVKGDEAEETRGSHRVLVGGGQDITIQQIKKERVGGDSHVHVAGDRIQHVGGSESVVSGGEIHVKADTAIVIEAARELTLKGPGGFIHIGAGGVTIVGTMVNINSGGAPGFSTARDTPEEPSLPETDDILSPDGMATRQPQKPAPLAKTDVAAAGESADPTYRIHREQVPAQKPSVNQPLPDPGAGSPKQK